MQLAYRTRSTDPCSGYEDANSRFALYCHGRVEDLHRIGGHFGPEAAM